MVKNRRKILGVLLAGALVVLSVDRFIGDGPGPQEASASDGYAPVQAADPNAPMPLDAVSMGPLTAPDLVDRLVALAEVRDLDGAEAADAFRPAESWAPPKPKAPEPVAKAGPTRQERIDAFLKAHKLTATFVMGAGGTAMIDGQCLQVGRTLAGYKLVSLTRDTATFESKDLKVVVPLSR